MASRVYLVALVLAFIAITSCVADCFSDCETDYGVCLQRECETDPDCGSVCSKDNLECKEDCLNK